MDVFPLQGEIIEKQIAMSWGFFIFRTIESISTQLGAKQKFHMQSHQL